MLFWSDRFTSRPTTDGVAMPMTSFPHIDPQHGRYTSGMLLFISLMAIYGWIKL